MIMMLSPNSTLVVRVDFSFDYLKRFDDCTYEKLTKSIELTNIICLPGSGNKEVKKNKKKRPYLVVNI